MNTAFFVALDLGQKKDYSALSLIEAERKAEPDLMVRLLRRYALGTPYPAIVASVGELVRREPLASNPAALVIDATGVGAPVVDMFKRERLPGRLVAVTITGGQSVREDGINLYVPKRDLVSTMSVLLQSARLKIAEGLREAATLTRELENFQVKITDAANDTYGAWRDGTNDDLVLSVAMGAWYALRVLAKSPTGRPRVGPPRPHIQGYKVR